MPYGWTIGEIGCLSTWFNILTWSMMAITPQSERGIIGPCNFHWQWIDNIDQVSVITEEQGFT